MRFAQLIAALVYAVGLLLIGGAASARADEPPPDAKQQTRVAELIEQLGDDQYTNREKASDALIRIGMPAQRQLRAALDSEDIEIRSRARRILKSVLAADFERRLQAFLADGEKGAKLPAWDKARKVLGDDRASRALFVQMLREERELLLAFDKSPKECGPHLVRSVAGIYNILLIYQDDANPPLGGVAAVVLVGAHPDVAINWKLYADICEESSYCSPFWDVKRGDPNLWPKIVKLLAGWIGKSTAVKDRSANWRAMRLGLGYKLDCALAPAARLLKDANAGDSYRSVALLAFGMLGDRDDLELIEPLLDDQQVCGRKYKTNGKDYIQVQVRDVALAVMVHLTGQDLQEYGYKEVAKLPLPILGNPSKLYFPNDAARQRALAKWKAWREKGN